MPTVLALFTPAERLFAELVVLLLTTNPFLPARVDLERAILGAAYVEAGRVWNFRANVTAAHENVRRIGFRVRDLLGRLHERFDAGVVVSDADRALYADFALYFLYDSYDVRFQPLILGRTTHVDFYDAFLADHARTLGRVGKSVPLPAAGHLFACFYQIRRAFHFIYTNLLGGSLPAARLRAATWRAIFSRDLRVYVETFYRTQDAISLLITGPTGSGKEIVAETVGCSRYLSFDPTTQSFPHAYDAHYHAFNLSEAAASVFESELFGHRRGAYTGALDDSPGLFALTRPGGTLFLDEVGELHRDIQTKLLRVLQTRKFRPVGGVDFQALAGKLVTATHRDLLARIQSGDFREDLYYRICGDRVVTPSLRAQLDDAPEERRHLVCIFATRLLGPTRGEALADELDAWFEKNLPPAYPWPGNMREMEHRVGLLLMQGGEHPEVGHGGDAPDPGEADEDFGRPFVEGNMLAEEALRRYATIVFADVGSYAETGRRLGVDRRTVGPMIDHALLARLKRRGKPR